MVSPLDGEGRKMSKSLGNVVAPGEVIDKFGADSLRSFVLSSSAPWDDLKFAQDELKNIHRTLNILWNVYRFPLPYMVLDNFDPAQVSLESVMPHLREEDRWILSKAQSLVAEVDDAMSKCTLHRH
ncbi:MAG: class I tRNA ligase family protein [Methanolobus sp.]